MDSSLAEIFYIGNSIKQDKKKCPSVPPKAVLYKLNKCADWMAGMVTGKGGAEVKGLPGSGELKRESV